MTSRWVISFSLLATCCPSAWSATVSGQVEASESKDRLGVVVWLEPLRKPPDTPPQVASIAHHHKTFIPHVVAVRTGSKVRFPNLDPFFHNAFSNYDGEIFDVGLHPPGSSREVTLRGRASCGSFATFTPR